MLRRQRLTPDIAHHQPTIALFASRYLLKLSLAAAQDSIVLRPCFDSEKDSMAEMQTQLRLLSLTTPNGRSFLPPAVAQSQLCLHIVRFGRGSRLGRAIERHGPR